MRNILARVFIIVAALSIMPAAALAERREITLPIPGAFFSGSARSIVFTPDGGMGFAAMASSLFSFSVADRRAISEFNLLPHFGSPPSILYMKAKMEAGLIVVYGNTHRTTTPDYTQRLVAVAFDQAGVLSERWEISYVPAQPLPELAFNDDGSRIYAVYTDFTHGEAGAAASGSPKSSATPIQRIDVIRSEDGKVLSTATLSEVGADVSVVFDGAHNRIIALAGTSANVFSISNDVLTRETVIGPVADLIGVTSPVISPDGRFVLAYAGFRPIGSEGINKFVCYDLELRTTHTLFLADKFFPASDALTFHRQTNTLLVPLCAWLQEDPNGNLDLSFTSSRQGHIIVIGNDGDLRQHPDVILPKRSPDGKGRNVIGFYNEMTISPSGALGFVSTHSFRLMSFDTLTGEIVNDQPLASENRTAIHYSPEVRALIYGSGNKVVLEDIDLGPVITRIDVSKNQTSISGTNFLFGAHVTINGVDLGVADRNPGDPGREIILQRGKKDFPAGENFTVVITNRDGLSSKPFTLRR